MELITRLRAHYAQRPPHFGASRLAGSVEEIALNGKMDVAEPISQTDQDFSAYRGSYQSQNHGAIFHFETTEFWQSFTKCKIL